MVKLRYSLPSETEHPEGSALGHAGWLRSRCSQANADKCQKVVDDSIPVRPGLQQMLSAHHCMSLSPSIPRAARTIFSWVGSVWSHWTRPPSSWGSIQPLHTLYCLRRRRLEGLWVVSPAFHSHDVELKQTWPLACNTPYLTDG